MKGRKLLMIPGPIEFEPAVIRAMGAHTTSHVAPDFIEIFGKSLELMREVWLSPSGQPFIIAGSGTLSMDMAAANLIETGDKALVVSTGHFGERYAEILKRYGADVTVLKANTGEVVSPELIEETLKGGRYKVLTFTHVDTSTAVLVNPEPIGRLGKKYGVLTILDGVCSVAGEEIRQDEWGIDVVLTASQKAVGVPPGLALLMVSENSINAWSKRKEPVRNYYADWANWLPVMNAYESRKPSYFATPPVNHINALRVSLEIILKEGMENRFSRHKLTGKAFRLAMKAVGLKQIPVSEDVSANTLSAVYYPVNISGTDFLQQVLKNDVILAGGLLESIKSKYFRVGHMGSVSQGDIITTIVAIERALSECGYKTDLGLGAKTALSIVW